MKVIIFLLCFITLVSAKYTQIMKPNSFKSLNNFTKNIENSKIVGGTESEPHSHPYQVAIFLQFENSTAFCGGSLISTEYVLTAAHCVFDGKNFVQMWTVILGAHNIFDEEDGIRMQSTTAIMHPLWEPQKLYNDLALIKLPTPAPLNDNIQIIDLPPFHMVDHTFVNATATISGWGKAENNASESLSDVLREVNVPVISNIECNITYLGIIGSNKICTSGADGKGICTGDSGSPLTTIFEGRKIQIGIILHGVIFGCATGWPQVYVRVTSYLFWISYITGIEIKP